MIFPIQAVWNLSLPQAWRTVGSALSLCSFVWRKSGFRGILTYLPQSRREMEIGQFLADIIICDYFGFQIMVWWTHLINSAVPNVPFFAWSATNLHSAYTICKRPWHELPSAPTSGAEHNIRLTHSLTHSFVLGACAVLQWIFFIPVDIKMYISSPILGT